MNGDVAMGCEVAREALSARMDGEDEGVLSSRVDEHLEQCPACCAWYIRAVEAEKAFRSHPAVARDLTDKILASTSGGDATPSRHPDVMRSLVRPAFFVGLGAMFLVAAVAVHLMPVGSSIVGVAVFIGLLLAGVVSMMLAAYRYGLRRQLPSIESVPLDVPPNARSGRPRGHLRAASGSDTDGSAA